MSRRSIRKRRHLMQTKVWRETYQWEQVTIYVNGEPLTCKPLTINVGQVEFFPEEAKQ